MMMDTDTDVDNNADTDTDTDGSDSEDHNDLIEDLAEEYLLGQSCCYITRPGSYRKQTIDNIAKLERMSEREFRACMRMSRANFDRLLGLIGNHSVFQSRGTKPQEPTAVQIALGLDCLGHFGNGMGITRLSSQ